MPRLPMPGRNRVALEEWDTDDLVEIQTGRQPLRRRPRDRALEAHERRTAERRKARRPHRAAPGARPPKGK